MAYVVMSGDARCLPLQDRSVACCVTSPPYWQLRDYQTGRWEGGDPACLHSPADTPGQRGLASSTLGGGKATTGHQREGYGKQGPRCGAVRVDAQIGGKGETLQDYLAALVQVCREVWRVLVDTGTLFVVMGDTYASAWPCARRNVVGAGSLENGTRQARPSRLPEGLREKSLIGVPWRLAFALQDAGWILRSAITWCKQAPMPESVQDRPSKATEQIFLFAKQSRYYYDATAVRVADAGYRSGNGFVGRQGGARDTARSGGPGSVERYEPGAGRNLWDYWVLPPDPSPVQHYATFPREIPRRCILAGCPPSGTVLDCFGGVGTTAVVAHSLGRSCVSVDLSMA